MVPGRLDYELTLALNRLWAGYTDLFDGLPYGDPYLAVTSLLAGMLLAGFSIKWVFQDDG